jgi:hypothetical protein
MRLVRPDRDEELLGDLLVRVSQRQQRQDLALALGERIVVRAPGRRLGVDQTSAELWMQIPAAGRDLANRSNHLVGDRLLE